MKKADVILTVFTCVFLAAAIVCGTAACVLAHGTEWPDGVGGLIAAPVVVFTAALILAAGLFSDGLAFLLGLLLLLRKTTTCPKKLAAALLAGCLLPAVPCVLFFVL